MDKKERTWIYYFASLTVNLKDLIERIFNVNYWLIKKESEIIIIKLYIILINSKNP